MANNPWDLIAEMVHDFNLKTAGECNHLPEIDDLLKAQDESGEICQTCCYESSFCDCECPECGFYYFDVDSAPLENCKTCGRELLEP